MISTRTAHDVCSRPAQARGERRARLVVLIGADLILAYAPSWGVAFLGIALWGLHMGITQGLPATMIAGTAPTNLRGTAFGFFNLLSGVRLLVASALAGLLWDRVGSALTFNAGVASCGPALVAIALKASRRHVPP
jgi:MFS family permease